MGTISKTRRALTIASALAALMSALPIAAHAQRNVTRIVVGFPPGGTLDFVARTIAQALGNELGQQVIVENKPGANGIIGGQSVARAAPDMTTLWLSSVGAVAITPSLGDKMPFDPERDLVPVSLVVRNVEVLVVNPSSPYNTAGELVAAARKGTKLKFASSGTGSVPHLAIELLNDVAKLDILHVPYKGGGPAVTDVMAGHVDGYFSDIPGVIGQIKSGKLKPIGVTGPRRHPLLPQVRTFDEVGLPGVEADNWNALFAPKGSSAADVARVGAALRRVLSTDSVKATLEASGAEASPSNSAEMAALLKTDSAKWARLIKAKNIRAD
jgi:tripartite-type tricarboxylate transporter receptor subunit TctC